MEWKIKAKAKPVEVSMFGCSSSPRQTRGGRACSGTVHSIPDLIKRRLSHLLCLSPHLETCDRFPMLRWTILRHHARRTRQTGLAFARKQANRNATTCTAGARWAADNTLSKPRARSSVLGNTKRRNVPINLNELPRLCRTDAWLALLQHTLPPELQDKNLAVEAGTQLTPREVFEVLSAAETESILAYRQDIFSYIACEKGRGDVVVWLVKHLVESLAISSPDADTTAEILCPWKNDTLLDELTRGPVDPLRSDFLQQAPRGQHNVVSLEAGTSNRTRQTVRHDALGMIWRGLGNMTIACSDGEVKPEILEIIAFLHHQGFMPSLIYDSKPSSDPTAIQQSPILNLLSSRILTSLSDAAWRAHEKSVVEEAKRVGSDSVSLRPEIPGSAYRVRVTGLKPEVWLELILWSCLRGEWAEEGMKILEKLHATQDQYQWSPLSWRSLVSTQPSVTREWERVEYLFNNWTVSSMDLSEPIVPVSVQRTVSSEVVNAYVDASVSMLRLSAGDRGRSHSQTVQFIGRMQQFLARSSLGLGAGSWDAIIMRLFDLHDNRIYSPNIFDRVIRLSPKMGQEIAASNVGSLPDYVFDGTAAIFGLFHRALHYRIQNADVEGALRLFAALQERADDNKRQSVVDFLQKHSLFTEEGDQASTGQFTNNLANIEYPAFYVQIPPTILGPFIELVTDAKAYDFGRWLLYSEEIDGPIVPESLYGDASITPALVRFAAETGDKVLLSRLVKIRAASAKGNEPTLPMKVLQSFLESQINLVRWPAAVKILQHLRDLYGLGWNVVTLCHLVRVSLLQVRRTETAEDVAKGTFGRARGLFRHLVRGDYEKRGAKPEYLQEQIDNLLVVLACIGEGWTGFSVNTQTVTGYRVFNLPSKAFNLVLEGVVDAYGSQSGRHLIGIFWNRKTRAAQSRESESDRRATDPPFSSFGQTLPPNIRRQRTEIRFPGSSQTRFTMYGGLRPDLMTIRIVLKKAIGEFSREADEKTEIISPQSSLAASAAEPAESEADELDNKQDSAIDSSPAGTVVWASRCLKRLGMTTEDIGEELRQSLPERQLQSILKKAPDLLMSRAQHEVGHVPME